MGRPHDGPTNSTGSTAATELRRILFGHGCGAEARMRRNGLPGCVTEPPANVALYFCRQDSWFADIVTAAEDRGAMRATELGSDT